LDGFSLILGFGSHCLGCIWLVPAFISLDLDEFGLIWIDFG
jgi:hypothetical protein